MLTEENVRFLANPQQHPAFWFISVRAAPHVKRRKTRAGDTVSVLGTPKSVLPPVEINGRTIPERLAF